MPVAGFLDDRLAGVQHGGVPLDLVADGVFDGAQRVDVLGLGADAEAFAAVRAQRDVGVAADVAAFHLGVRDAEVLDDLADRGHVGLGELGRAAAGALDRLGDDLDQRHAGAVVVHQRVVRALDAAGGAAHVGQLAGVLLHVGAFDLDAEHRAVGELDVQVAVVRDGLVVLGGLEVLRGVRVEVVLPGEAAGLGDLAVQRQADLDRGLDRGLVHHRQHAGHAEVHLVDVGVGLVAEDVRCGGEHLGLGVELHVDLEAQDGIVLLHRLFEAEGCVSH